jgi:hypothetical protein
MADRPGPVPSAPAPSTGANETPLPDAGQAADDPGGAHGKGYTADPPDAAVGPHVAKKEAYRLAPEKKE